jgi:hypothetical protein
LIVCVVAALVAGEQFAFAATQVLAPSDDTFINSGNPGNNNGASLSIFTGTDGHGGIMRGLIRFAMPASLRGRVTVTSVQLVMTVEALGNGGAGTAATESLQAVIQSWIQGNGIGNTTMLFTVGQACGGSVVGATWNQTNCANATNWTTAGGSVVSAVSGQSSTAGIAIGSPVTWSSAGMIADVQAWIDTPPNNNGWRIASSTEGVVGEAQRFFSSESGSTPPALTITYSCKPGFVPSGNDCVAPATPALSASASGLLAILLCGAVFVMLGRSPLRLRRA